MSRLSILLARLLLPARPALIPAERVALAALTADERRAMRRWTNHATAPALRTRGR